MYIQEYKVKRDMSMNLISGAICHFDQKNKLSFHSNAYFLTIHVKKLSDIPKIIEVVYLRIVNSLFNKGVISGKWNGSDRPGMVSCGDTENSRRDRLTDKPVYPHIHSVLFIPGTDHLSFSPAYIRKIVEWAVMDIREVDSVYIKKCTDINCIADVARTIEYAVKAFFKDSGNLTAFASFEPRVFPYQLDIRRKPRRTQAIQTKAAKTEKFLMARMIERWAWKSDKTKLSAKRLCRRHERLRAKKMGEQARRELLEFAIDFAPKGQDVDVFLTELLELDENDIGAWMNILDEGINLVFESPSTEIAASL